MLIDILLETNFYDDKRIIDLLFDKIYKHFSNDSSNIITNHLFQKIYNFSSLIKENKLEKELYIKVISSILKIHKEIKNDYCELLLNNMNDKEKLLLRDIFIISFERSELLIDKKYINDFVNSLILISNNNDDELIQYLFNIIINYYMKKKIENNENEENYINDLINIPQKKFMKCIIEKFNVDLLNNSTDDKKFILSKTKAYIKILKQFIKNKTYKFDDEKDYEKIDDFLKKIKGNVIISEIFFEGKNTFCIDFYLGYYINLSKENSILFYSEYLTIMNKNSFIFKLLEELINEKKIEFIVKIIEKINNVFSVKKSLLKEIINSQYEEISIKKNLINNLFHLIFYLDFLFNNDIINESNLYENKKLFEIVKKTIENLNITYLSFYPFCLFKTEKRCKKLICEMVIDILFNYLSYYFSQNDNKINIILDNIKKFIFLKKKEHTIFYFLDLYYEERYKNEMKIDNVKIIEKYLPFQKYSMFNISYYILGKIFLFYDNFIQQSKNKDNKFKTINEELDKIMKTLFYDCCDIKYKNKNYNNNNLDYELYNTVKNIIEKNSVSPDYSKMKEKLENKFHLNHYSFILKYKDINAYNCIINNKKEEEKDIEKKDEKIIFVKEEIKEDKINIFHIEKNFNNYPFFYMNKDNNIFFQKRDLFLNAFSNHFLDCFFYNEKFKIMKSYFISKYKVNSDNKLLNFPSKIKNYSNEYHPRLFLTHYFHFFTSNFFEISHPYFKEFNQKIKNNYISLHKKNIFICENELIDCEYVNPTENMYGKIFIFENFLLFKSQKNLPKSDKYIITEILNECISKDKRIIIFFEEIDYIIQRRFLFLWNAIEFYLKNGKSYYFNLFQNNYNIIINELKVKRNIKIIEKESFENNINEYKRKFENKEISIYEYLLYLNNYSSRSFNALSTYPIFPWPIKEYNGNFDLLKVLNNKIDNSYIRDFKYPMSCQTKETQNLTIIRYVYGIDENFKFHLGIHYSNSAYIDYYLMRTYPHINNQIKIQNYKMEISTRIFHCFETILKNLYKGMDCREMIPEFYTSIEFWINLNCIYLGNNQDKKIMIDDLLICDNVNLIKNNIVNYIKFFTQLNILINSDYIRKSICDWIDNVFGINQYIQNDELRKNSCNVFEKITYEEFNNMEKLTKDFYSNDGNKDKKYKDIKENIIMNVNHAINFGQIPYKILKNYHKIGNKKENNGDDKTIYNEITLNNNTELIYLTVLNKENEYLIFTIERENDNIFIREKTENISIQLTNIKLFKKNINEEEIIYLKNPKYIFTLLTPSSNESLLVTCRYIDNSIKIFYRKEDLLKIRIIEILSFVNCVQKINENNFFIGCKNGRLLKYSFSKELIFINSIQAHKSMVNLIEINNNLNIIITSGDDNLIYLRKLYDYELLSVINLSYNLFPYEIKISDLNILYCTCLLYDKTFIILNYTVNGLFISKSYSSFKNFDFHNNDLICLLNNSNKIVLLESYDLSIKSYYEIINQDNFSHFYYNKNNIYIGNDCKIINDSLHSKNIKEIIYL